MKKYIYLLVVSFSIFSCSDEFLEKNPLDEISEPEFWKTPADLKLYANSFYQNLPGWGAVSLGFSQLPDSDSDLLIGTAPSSRLLGNTNVPTAKSNSVWNWANVRKANYFIDNVSKATGDPVEIAQYTGEGYFFRAFYYYSLLQNYGNLPIIDKYLKHTDVDYLYKGRDPRNKVVDFMLADLDIAISKLKTKAQLLTNPRINKEAALLLKAHIALYEGTWEKYHSGTAFGVAGSTGTDYLQKAADAAKAIIDGGAFTLHSNYGSLFNQITLNGNTEVILWRQYDFVTFGTNYGNSAQIWPNRSSYTRFAIRNFLCKDGLPIAVSPLYQGDQSLSVLETNRDPRLAAIVMVPGDVRSVAVNGTTTLFTTPILTTNNAAVGGYESQKYRIPNFDPATNAATRNTAKIIMRYAEALLIYAEAKAELGTITQNDLNISINKLRQRAGMPNLNMTAIVTDPNWPDYGYPVTPLLQEIRRERAVELIAEGFRFDDLMRWRAHKLFVVQRPRGAYYQTGWAANQRIDSERYLDPFQVSVAAGYAFKPDRDYLQALPIDELTLNPNLLPQNPGWVN
ncbi:RagB/SusD family nutrient uptake outer membrane protein [Flavobacterium sp. UMI-01]|uniref:RagB/SusD family nutrient uptake outer membrane protein n=1 Tax=Flavobacterium sp. UMI-01 TaxID=1441053 RepID=UPI001C7DDF40|nr:RagB/SusD family nutrient uptake outer membrane protein [Flavobacterium sp. UMI-01]GIZ10230.1 hypothetical protein FUMI01_29560 [Flavobacterium sp. UMI-01]